MTKTFRYLAAMFTVLGAMQASAALAPTPAQIEQFKALSPAEQQALAKSVGVDVPGLGTNTAQPQITEAPSAVPIAPAASEPVTNVKTNPDASIADNTVKPFGADIFNGAPSSFMPATDIPVPADYVMGPGDNIVIQLYGKENNAYSLAINREGQIQFPSIGPVSLAGLSFSQAQTVITEVVEKQMIGIKSSVTMGALRSIRVFVLGEVLQPGSFTVSSLSTMTNALFASGGVSKIGSLRNIQLKRQGKVVTSLDLYDLLLHGDTSSDVRLLPGDVIFVPPLGETISVTGAVTRPAIYELTSSASVIDAINLAGGTTTSAYLPVSRVERIGGNGERTLLNLDLSKAKDKSLLVADGDKIKISSVLDFVQDKVTLRGNIKRAGQYAWSKGLHFSDAIPSVDALLPNPDIDVALIKRELPGTRQIEVLLFSPKLAWSNKHSATDPELRSNDEVFIFDFVQNRSDLLADIKGALTTQSQYDERQKVVTIDGNVRFPGSYPLAERMTAQDLVALAGGLTESALGTQGEITRYSISENRQRVVMHVQADFANQKVVLEPADTLQIKQIPLWKKKETVELVGEVVFPGTYSILPGETLLDVLTRAGGLAPHAYPEGAIFSRAELRRLEAQRVQELKNTLEADLAASSATDETGKKNLDEVEANKIIRSLGGSKLMGRLIIDLPLVIKNPKQSDFQLEDGDRLIVPRYNPSVSVVGEIQYATSHFFNPKFDALDYVDHSGGAKKNADTKRMYIVKANGSVIGPKSSNWGRAGKGGIAPGDTIVVPLETDKKDKLEIWAKASTIIYNAAIGAAALVALQ